LLSVRLEFAAEIIPVIKSHTDMKFRNIQHDYNLNEQAMFNTVVTSAVEPKQWFVLSDWASD